MDYKRIFNGIFICFSIIYLVGFFSKMNHNVINVACAAISIGGLSAGQIGMAENKYEKFHLGVCIFLSVILWGLVFIEPNYSNIPAWSSVFLLIAVLINMVSLL